MCFVLLVSFASTKSFAQRFEDKLTNPKLKNPLPSDLLGEWKCVDSASQFSDRDIALFLGKSDLAKSPWPFATVEESPAFSDGNSIAVLVGVNDLGVLSSFRTRFDLLKIGKLLCANIVVKSNDTVTSSYLVRYTLEAQRDRQILRVWTAMNTEVLVEAVQSGQLSGSVTKSLFFPASISGGASDLAKLEPEIPLVSLFHSRPTFVFERTQGTDGAIHDLEE